MFDHALRVAEPVLGSKHYIGHVDRLGTSSIQPAHERTPSNFFPDKRVKEWLIYIKSVPVRGLKSVCKLFSGAGGNGKVAFPLD